MEPSRQLLRMAECTNKKIGPGPLGPKGVNKMRKLLKEYLEYDGDKFEFELEHESEIAKDNERIARENGFEEVAVGLYKRGDELLDLNTALAFAYYTDANDENTEKIIGWEHLENEIEIFTDEHNVSRETPKGE